MGTFASSMRRWHGLKGTALKDLLKSFGPTFRNMQKQTHDEQLKQAINASLEGYRANEKRYPESSRALNQWLRVRNLKRVEIPGEGDWQFEAITKTLGLQL